MKILRLTIGIILLLFIVIAIALVFSYPFMAVNKPVKSKNLVVEGWLSGCELESIIAAVKNYDLTNIIVTGKYFDEEFERDISSDHYKPGEFFKWGDKTGAVLLANSSLLVDLSKLQPPVPDSIFSVSVKASDTRKNKIFAHFNVILNGKWLGDSFTTDSLEEYKFRCNATFTGNPVLAICFDNDANTSGERRNLYVYSVRLNEYEYYIDNSYAIITREENLLTTGFRSEAAKTAQYLKALNTDPGIIDIVEFKTAEKNQTLASALKVKGYLEDHPVNDLNITSAGIHARRSLFTYKKVLNPEIKFGIVNSEDAKYNRYNWYKSPEGIRLMLDEFFSYIYVRISLSLSPGTD